MIKEKSEKILINAANLHSGGGVQVTVSFLKELINLNEVNTNVIVSRKVHNELMSINANVEKFNSYNVHDVFGIRALIDLKFINFISSNKTIFTVFGPLYTWRKPKKSITGFAQPWIIYADNEIYNSYNIVYKGFIKFKYAIQKYFYFKSDQLVVELDHVKKELKKLTNTTEILVIKNCISSIYSNNKEWKPINKIQEKQKFLLLGIVTRDYPHKNLNILPEVIDILKYTYKMDVRFLVTLTSKEWLKKNKKFRTCVDNIGPISIAECPSFYNLLDGVILPSLLECFSATPIEAMIMKKPVFASDRIFIRQACKNFVNYFEPTNPKNIAESIYKYFNNVKSKNSHFIEIAYKFALKYNNPTKRAKSYIKNIK